MAQKGSEQVALIGALDPQDAGGGAVTSDWAPIKLFEHAFGLLLLGATDGTVDAKLQEASDSSGTGAADLTGKAITQLSATDDNKQAVIDVQASDLSDGMTHVAMVVTGAGTANLVAAGIFGVNPRYAPASDNDVASVAEIV